MGTYVIGSIQYGCDTRMYLQHLYGPVGVGAMCWPYRIESKWLTTILILRFEQDSSISVTGIVRNGA